MIDLVIKPILASLTIALTLFLVGNSVMNNVICGCGGECECSCKSECTDSCGCGLINCKGDGSNEIFSNHAI